MKKYPMQEEPQKWDVVFARIKVNKAITGDNSELIKSQLAMALGLQLMEHLEVEEVKGVFDPDSDFHQVALPVGPWHFVTEREHQSRLTLESIKGFAKNDNSKF